MRLPGCPPLSAYVVMGVITTFLCRGGAHHDIQLTWVRGRARTSGRVTSGRWRRGRAGGSPRGGAAADDQAAGDGVHAVRRLTVEGGQQVLGGDPADVF